MGAEYNQQKENRKPSQQPHVNKNEQIKMRLKEKYPNGVVKGVSSSVAPPDVMRLTSSNLNQFDSKNQTKKPQITMERGAPVQKNNRLL
jgi:hypothetical protein